MKYQLPPSSIEVDGQEFDLDKIRCFRGSFEQLLRHVSGVFTLPGSYCEFRDDGKWYLCTGDWTSLDEVLAAMKHVPLFWIGCWISSSRDGCHVFTTAEAESYRGGGSHIMLSENELVEPINRKKLLSELESLSDSQLDMLVSNSRYKLPELS